MKVRGWNILISLFFPFIFVAWSITICPLGRHDICPTSVSFSVVRQLPVVLKCPGAACLELRLLIKGRPSNVKQSDTPLLFFFSFPHNPSCGLTHFSNPFRPFSHSRWILMREFFSCESDKLVKGKTQWRLTEWHSVTLVWYLTRLNYSFKNIFPVKKMKDRIPWVYSRPNGYLNIKSQLCSFLYLKCLHWCSPKHNTA